MTTTATQPTTRLSLLRPIPDPANDGNDTPRLVFADLLQGEAETVDVPCPTCEVNFKTNSGGGLGFLLAGEPGAYFHVPCPVCGDPKSNGGILDDNNIGTGTVRVSADADRAELVRVHCRMDAIRRECLCGVCVKRRGGGQRHNGPCGIDRRQDDGVHLRRRESELLARWPAWSAWPCPAMNHSDSAQCPVCLGSGDMLRTYDRGSTHWEVEAGSASLPVTWEVGHLFPRSVTVATLGEALQWVNRENRLTAPLQATTFGPEWKLEPTPRLCALASPERWGVPVGAVMVADRVVGVGDYYAFNMTDGKIPETAGYWLDMESAARYLGNEPQSHWIPGPIAKLLKGGIRYVNGIYYPTPDAANLALGRAIVQFGRAPLA